MSICRYDGDKLTKAEKLTRRGLAKQSRIDRPEVSRVIVGELFRKLKDSRLQPKLQYETQGMTAKVERTDRSSCPTQK